MLLTAPVNRGGAVDIECKSERVKNDLHIGRKLIEVWYVGTGRPSTTLVWERGATQETISTPHRQEGIWDDKEEAGLW